MKAILDAFVKSMAGYRCAMEVQRLILLDEKQGALSAVKRMYGAGSMVRE